MEVVYYTCLNKDCYRYRGVFVEGDPQHERCDRAPLELEGTERKASRWMRLAVPVALAAGVVAVATMVVRRMSSSDEPPIERSTQSWSGDADVDARGTDYSAPAPMASDT